MFKRILVPIDVDDTGNAARCLTMAKGFCNADGEISALHVIEDIPAHVRALLSEDVFDAAKARAQRKMAEIVEPLQTQVAIDIRIGKPAAEILDLAKTAAVDLVILGSGKTDISTYLIGSTATRVVQHAPCPVLVVR